FAQARRGGGAALPRRPAHRGNQRQHRTADHHRVLPFGGRVVSLGNPLKQVSLEGAAARLHELRASIVWSLALVARPPKSVVTPKWRAPLRLALRPLSGGRSRCATQPPPRP